MPDDSNEIQGLDEQNKDVSANPVDINDKKDGTTTTEGVAPSLAAEALKTMNVPVEPVKEVQEEGVVLEETATASDVSEKANERGINSDEIERFLLENNLAEYKDNSLVIKGTQKKSKVPVILLTLALIMAFLFIGFQSVYIWKLNVGELEKNSIPTVNEFIKGSQSKKKDKDDKKEKEDVTNPHFSIADAAAVTDKDKKALSTVDIYNKVYPATVTIYIKGEVDGVESTVAAGSGFILTDDGYIVTNEHVVEGDSTAIEVIVPYEESSYKAELVGKDVQTDIAILKINADKKLPTVVLGDSDVLQNGELAVAIGCPLGSFEGTITVGVVSGVERPMNNNGYSMNLIQTDASVNSGNSGGALINSFGEVIGVVNAKIASAEGLGFAIPINSVKGIIESIIVNGKVINRPFLGITVRFIPEDEYFGAVQGVFVNDCTPGGPGEEAGVLPGDRIVSMDGVEITESNDIILVRDSHECGDEITVVVDRDGQMVELTLVIGDSADFE